VLVSGEAGIGKSRLVEEVLARTRDRPLLGAVGQCYEYLQTPFGPFSDIFARLQDKSAAFGGEPDVREAVGELTSSQSREAVLDRFDKRQLFKALRRAFELLSALSPMVVALDDIHWADQSTLEFLQFLADCVPRSRLVLIATYRSSESDQSDAFRRALAHLSRGPGSSSRTLGPLVADEIRSMLHADGSGSAAAFNRLVAEVVAHADGNPLFAGELLKSAMETDEPGESLPLPISVREAVLRRVERLSGEQRRCISCASAIGRRFSPSLLARIAGQSLDEALSALETATQEDLMESEIDGDTFRFRHELTRRSIYEELLPATARSLHERVAESLEENTSTSALADLAYHYWMSANSVKAADFNEQAGDRARALFSYSEARTHYDRALEALGNAQSERIASLRERMGRCLYQTGSSDAALVAYQAARTYYESQGMDAAVARLCIWIATLRWAEGREQDAITECMRALELVDETNVAYFQAHAFLGHFTQERDNAEALEHFELAQRYAGPRNVDDSFIFHQCRALALASRGDVDGADADFRRAAKLMLERENYSLAVRCLGNLGLRLTDLGERGRALLAFDEASQIVEREELWDVDCAVLLRQYAWARLQFGDLAQARGLIGRALKFPLDSSRLRIFAAQAAMLIGLRTLDDELIAQVDDPALLAEALESGNESMLIAALAFAERDVALGRTDAARETIRDIVTAYGAVKQARDDDGVFVLVAQSGSEEDALAAREFVQRFRDETGAAVAKAHLLLFDSVSAERHGDGDHARMFAGQAFDIYHALGWRWHEARALEFAGKRKEAMRAYEAAGDLRSAQHLQEALNPVNRQGRTASDLTKRESEIARLAADGKTNREIADALTLSPRTVETHVSAILGKLSVSTRAELSAKWRDLALDGGQVSSRSRRH